MRPLAPLAIVLALAAGSAHAQPVIDDFETGTFSLQAPSGAGAATVVPVSAPSHAIALNRDVALTSNGPDPSGADLVAFSMPDDEIAMVMPTNGGELKLRYAPAVPVDLTNGGVNDRVEARFSIVAGAAVMSLEMTDIANNVEVANVNVTAPGFVVFPFTDFPTLDLTAIQSVAATVTMPLGDFHLTDIRARRSASGAVKFDNTFSPVSGPAYPTAPLIFDVTDAELVEILQVSLADVHNPPGAAAAAPTAILAEGMDSGNGMGSFGEVADVKLWWDNPLAGWMDSSFDLFFEFLPSPGQPLTPHLPALPTDPFTPTGFSLSFEIQYMNASGQVVSSSMRELAFDAFDGQGMEFQNVMVLPAVAPAQGAGGVVEGFHVTFDAVEVGTVDVGKALLEATMTGDCRPDAATGVRGSPGPEGIRLAASPSPFREGTRVSFTLPGPTSARVSVYDVAGRRVATLSDGMRAAGIHSVSWDGRDVRGGAVAPGVYLLRLETGESARTRKVVRVR